MATAQVGTKGNIQMVILIGDIDDQTNLDTVIGPIAPPPSELHLNLKGVTRINSVGIKGWITYFNKIKAQGNRISFWECSAAIVQQINIVVNFDAGAKIQSVLAAYVCSKCENNFEVTLKSEDVLAAKLVIANQKCPKCGGDSEFDDLPASYFKFLNR